MKTLNDIIAELQALDQAALDSVVAGLNQAIADLQTIAASAQAQAADPVATIVVKTQSGAETTFVPQA
jgi:hypothetical protein